MLISSNHRIRDTKTPVAVVEVRTAIHNYERALGRMNATSKRLNDLIELSKVENSEKLFNDFEKDIRQRSSGTWLSLSDMKMTNYDYQKSSPHVYYSATHRTLVWDKRLVTNLRKRWYYIGSFQPNKTFEFNASGVYEAIKSDIAHLRSEVAELVKDFERKKEVLSNMCKYFSMENADIPIGITSPLKEIA